MKEKRLLNELGNVNDEFVEQAKPKVKNSRKRLYAIIGSVAATAAVFVTVFATGNGLLKNADNDFNNSSSAITNESTNETALAYSNINIYYLNGSSTERTTKYLPCDPKVIFPSGKTSIASAMMYVLSSALSTATAKRKSTKAQPPTLSATKRLLN